MSAFGHECLRSPDPFYLHTVSPLTRFGVCIAIEITILYLDMINEYYLSQWVLLSPGAKLQWRCLSEGHVIK